MQELEESSKQALITSSLLVPRYEFEGGRHMDWSNKMCLHFLEPWSKL